MKITKHDFLKVVDERTAVSIMEMLNRSTVNSETTFAVIWSAISFASVLYFDLGAILSGISGVERRVKIHLNKVSNG